MTRPGNTLPMKICFRVTRFCNARCGFCLAPPDGGDHPPASRLMSHIDWLFERGVRSIHFCGGEPTIHQDLPILMQYVHARGGKPLLTTNGISLSDAMIAVLRATKAEVKVSLHGPRELHNALVGRDAFEATTGSIARLVAWGVRASVQCTIIHDHLDAVEWIIRHCLDHRIKRACFLPFIPRGNGNATRGIYELSYPERRRLKDLVKQKRRELGWRMEIRLLDFNVKPVPVVEPDGRVILEGSTETLDVLLQRIPSG